jgi:hypothetical protein
MRFLEDSPEPRKDHEKTGISHQPSGKDIGIGNFSLGLWKPTRNRRLQRVFWKIIKKEGFLVIFAGKQKENGISDQNHGKSTGYRGNPWPSGSLTRNRASQLYFAEIWSGMAVF